MRADQSTIVEAAVRADSPSGQEQFAGLTTDQVTVDLIMHPGVIVAAPESPLRHVAGLMARHRVHAVVVLGDDEEGGVWGLVSDTDVLGAIARGELDQHTAGAMARTPVLSVSRRDSMERAAQLMSEHALTHLLVVADGRHPVGVVSTLDLASAAAAGMVDPSAIRRRRELVSAADGNVVVADTPTT